MPTGEMIQRMIDLEREQNEWLIHRKNQGSEIFLGNVGLLLNVSIANLRRDEYDEALAKRIMEVK